ncbi:MAG: L-2-amino-thiazoline-4-carboxylic acid hydrolase [Candidatus Altiarchaeota archaeon]|nr:L-2-amino-thiazoline-4-carboxylic acid hydrolase [Candidatus Altiarchaeota archaeon]
MEYDDGILKEYYRRSYFAVDGLWFMKVEEDSSFEKALELDEKVWRVLPKIQARKVKELLGIDGDSVRDLIKALELKWTAEDYGFKVVKRGKDHAEIHLKKCPWYELMKKSGRKHLAEQIGGLICTTEYGAWAKEFDQRIEFKLENMLCRDDKPCRLTFKLGDE